MIATVGNDRTESGLPTDSSANQHLARDYVHRLPPRPHRNPQKYRIDRRGLRSSLSGQNRGAGILFDVLPQTAASVRTIPLPQVVLDT
jgi:hypothetical protein